MFDRHTVIGVQLFEFIDWANDSFKWLKNYADNNQENGEVPRGGLLALPPMQRSAVWRVKQVLDLWDSVLSGMPIGSFYLMDRLEECSFVTNGEKTLEISVPGYDLLDGQQRLRALLVGATEFSSEKRCLWIDLGTNDTTDRPRLHITSKAQPFGYDARGQKLGIPERRKARQALTPPENQSAKLINKDHNENDVYDSDLFDGVNIYINNKLFICPPKPYGATLNTFKLYDLIKAWRPYQSKSQEARIGAIRHDCKINTGSCLQALNSLDDALMRMFNSQVALIRVRRDSFAFKSNSLTLFERIGAGGTPLTDNERRYSIYKFYVPHVRDAVNKIHTNIGLVLSGTEIAVSAIRIAYSEANTGKNDQNHNIDEKINYVNMPDVHTVVTEISKENSPLRLELNKLLPENNLDDNNNLLMRAFIDIYQSLCFDIQNTSSTGDYWIPDIIIANLPPELWQVLTYDIVKNQKINLCRQDIVRFVMWWYIFVFDNSKASDLCFRVIKNQSIKENLWKLLYNTIISSEYGYRLVSCEYAKREWFSSNENDYQWKTSEERFGKNESRNLIAAHWWCSSKKSLFWLQKDYLRDKFRGFKPLSEHEEDTPYDFDHICPANDFYYSVWSRLEVDDLENLRTFCENGRKSIDESIGNYRIVNSSQNRHESDDDISVKMPSAIRVYNLSNEEIKDRANFAMSADKTSIELWSKVSYPGNCGDRRWNKNRLAAFQRAVEHRAAWLYCKFYTELDFDKWSAITPKSSDPKP